MGKWASGQMMEWASELVGKWASGQVTKWASDQVGEWASGQMMEWVKEQVGKWSHQQMGKWSSEGVSLWQSAYDSLNEWVTRVYKLVDPNFFLYENGWRESSRHGTPTYYLDVDLKNLSFFCPFL